MPRRDSDRAISATPKRSVAKLRQRVSRVGGAITEMTRDQFPTIVIRRRDLQSPASRTECFSSYQFKSRLHPKTLSRSIMLLFVEAVSTAENRSWRNKDENGEGRRRNRSAFRVQWSSWVSFERGQLQTKTRFLRERKSLVGNGGL